MHVAGDPASQGIRVPFVRPALPPPEAVRPAIDEIVRTGRLTKGPFVERLEKAIAERLGVRHAVAVSSCTVGLMLVYRGLDLAAGSCRSRRGIAEGCGVGAMEPLSRFGTVRSGARSEPLGEVIIPSFTFLAGAAAIVWNNLRPVFIDADPRTTNVTPQAVAAAITPRTVAISACHNFGNPCDIPALETLAADERAYGGSGAGKIRNQTGFVISLARKARTSQLRGGSGAQPPLPGDQHIAALLAPHNQRADDAVGLDGAGERRQLIGIKCRSGLVRIGNHLVDGHLSEVAARTLEGLADQGVVGDQAGEAATEATGGSGHHCSGEGIQLREAARRARSSAASAR
jgi:hypothetical protein